jgi:hypothetical protein
LADNSHFYDGCGGDGGCPAFLSRYSL